MLIVVLLVGAVVFVVLSSRAPRSGPGPARRRTLEDRRSRPGAIPLREAPDPELPDGVVPGFAPPAAAPATAPVPAALSAAEVGDEAAAGDLPWNDGSGWDGWDDAESTRVGSLGGPGSHTGDDTGPGASVTAGGASDNIGGTYPARPATTADPSDDPYPGAYHPGGAHTGESRASAHGTGGLDVSGLDSGSRDTYMNDSRDPDATGWTPPPSGRPHKAEADDSAYRLPTDVHDHGHGGGGYSRPTQAAYPGPDSYPDPAAGHTRRVSNDPDSTWAAPPADWPPPPPGVIPAPTPSSEATTAPGVELEAPSPESGEAGYVAAEPVHTTAPALRLASAGRTRRGKRGGPNEDAWVVSDGLLAVSDGVGGEAAGQIASTLAVTTVAGFRPQYAANPADGLRQAVARANQVVREKAREEPAWRGMACTLDVVILGRQQSTGETLFIAHVGDSSVWLQPQKGRPHQITTPHAIKNGPLLNAIGLADQIEADILREPVRANDRVILASDGITKVMTSEQLLGLMSELGAEPPERAADALVEAALLAGARDDTTIVVADLVTEPSPR